MPRKSSPFVWKEGDGEGRKDDSNPKLYDQPPHKLFEGDESTYPRRFVDLSSMLDGEVQKDAANLLVFEQTEQKKW